MVVLTLTIIEGLLSCFEWARFSFLLGLVLRPVLSPTSYQLAAMPVLADCSGEPSCCSTTVNLSLLIADRATRCLSQLRRLSEEAMAQLGALGVAVLLLLLCLTSTEASKGTLAVSQGQFCMVLTNSSLSCYGAVPAPGSYVQIAGSADGNGNGAHSCARSLLVLVLPHLTLAVCRFCAIAVNGSIACFVGSQLALHPTAAALSVTPKFTQVAVSNLRTNGAEAYACAIVAADQSIYCFQVTT